MEINRTRHWLAVALCGAALGLVLASGLLPALGWLALGAWCLAVVLVLAGEEAL